MKRYSGFTLIELLVVVILIGVLATLSLSRYNWVAEKARGAEAKEVLLKSYAGYKRLLVDEETINVTFPLSWTRLGMSNPNLMATRLFNYTILPDGNSPTTILANSTRFEAGWLQVNLTSGAINKSNPY